MKRDPKSWAERFDDSLTVHPSPALEDWRWSRENEGKVDSRAVSAAWDLVTLQASAEAAKLHHIMQALDGPLAKTLLPALVVAGARWTEVGMLQIIGKDGKDYWPRDLSFVPGREHLSPQLTLQCHIKVGRATIDFLLGYEHTEYLVEGEHMEKISAKRSMAILLDERSSGRKVDADRRKRDIELQQEGHLLIRYERSDLWRDAVGCADDALRTLVQSTRFDCEEKLSTRLRELGETQ